MNQTKVNSEKRNGILQSHKSSFATLYRMVDLVCLSVLYFLVLIAHGYAVNSSAMPFLFFATISFMLTAEAFDLYRSWRTETTIAMLHQAIVVWLITCAASVACAYFFPAFVGYSHITILLWLCACAPVLAAWRIVFRRLLFWQRGKGNNIRSAIVVGANNAGFNLVRQFELNEQLGIKCKGVFDDRQPERLPHEFLNQVSGNFEDALTLARENKVDFIYISLPMCAEKRIMQMLNMCSDTTCTVSIIPNFFMYNLLHARWQSVGALQTLSVFDTPFQGADSVLKRIEDILLSSAILTFIAVPMLFIAAAIKLTSPGPAIFKQSRYGLDGKEITIYKFRSMTAQDNGKCVMQATKNDSRITPLGAFLRRTSLDELPQFINVLQGRMSIVGPRPHAVSHNEEYRKLIEGYMLRHKVRPGITGWAQINGFRGETETVNKMVKRVEYDLDYIHRWSMWLDVKIILATVFKGFVGKNAY